MKAPEVIDLEKLMTWVNGSIGALLVLNLLSLAFFLSSLLYPSIKSIIAAIIAWKQQRKLDKLAQVTETPVEQTQEVILPPETPKVEEATVIASPQPIVSSPAPMVDMTDLKTPSNPNPEQTAMSSEEINQVLDIPVPAPSELPSTPTQFDPPTEILEQTPEPEPLATTAPANEAIESTAEIENAKIEEVFQAPPSPPPPAPPLVQSEPNEQPIKPATALAPNESLPDQALKAIEDSLSAGFDQPTEELSIFDPSTLDTTLAEQAALEDKKP